MSLPPQYATCYDHCRTQNRQGTHGYVRRSARIGHLLDPTTWHEAFRPLLARPPMPVRAPVGFQ